jgi:hypothetical protein
MECATKPVPRRCSTIVASNAMRAQPMGPVGVKLLVGVKAANTHKKEEPAGKLPAGRRGLGGRQPAGLRDSTGLKEPLHV